MKRNFLICIRLFSEKEMKKYTAIVILFLIYSISPWFFLTDTRAEQIDNNKITGLWFGTYTGNHGERSLLINISNENNQDTKAIFIFGPTYRNSSVPSGSFYMNVTYDTESASIELVGIEWIDRPSNYQMIDMSGIVSVFDNKTRMAGGIYRTGSKRGDFLLIHRCVRTVLDTPTAQGFVYPVWISVEDAGKTKPNTSLEFGAGWGDYKGHLGEDYAYPAGRNVRAAYNGRVVESGFDGTASTGFGNYIIIRHEHPALPNNGVIYSLYAHLQTRSKQSGEHVTTGEVIGTIGDTGFATGPHLHFEIKTEAALGRGYTGTNFTSYTVVDSGMTYYRPSTFIETYRSLSPTQPRRISLPGVLKLLLGEPSDDVTVTPHKPSNRDPGTLSSPGPIFEDNKVTLTWDHSDGATHYDLGVRDLGTNALVVDQHVQSNSLSVTLEFGRSYRWNLSACNDAGCSDFTDPLYFRISHTDSDHLVLLDVPYLHQIYDTLDDFDGSWACGPTSAVMLLAYYQLLEPDSHSGYGKYVSEIYSSYDKDGKERIWNQFLDMGNNMAGHGAWGHINQPDGFAKGPLVVEYLVGHGIQSSLIDTSSEVQVRSELDEGYPVIASTHLIKDSAGNYLGHLVVITGYEYKNGDYKYIINDPWGDPNHYSTQWGPPGSGYQAKVTWEQMMPLYNRWMVTARPFDP